jgi:amino acid transporter
LSYCEDAGRAAARPEERGGAVDDAGMQGLQRRTLSPLEIFGQAIGNTGMATVVAFTPAFVAATAGDAAWLSVLIATIAILATGYCVSLFARRYASSGSLYTFVAQVLGPAAGFLVGWALILAYGGLAVAVPGLGAVYLGELLTAIGVNGATDAWQIVFFGLLAVVVTLFAYQGVRLSTRTSLILEATTLTILGIILVAVLINSDDLFDSAQLELHGSSLHDVFLGITLAVTAFVGFESGASLGAEARNPRRAIPRVIMLTAAFAGVIYLFATYTSILGFHSMGAPITESESPIDDLRVFGGVDFLRYPVAAGLAVSFFAIILASVNALARMLFTMAHEGVLPAAFGRAHPRHRTPYVGIFLIAPLLFLVPLVMKEIANADAADAFTYVATPSTFGFMFAYVLIAVGAPVLVHRATGRLDWRPVFTGLLATAAMIATYVSNITPTPPWPLDMMPYLFAGLMVLGGLFYAGLRARDPQVGDRIGSVEEDEDGPEPGPATRPVAEGRPA